MRNLINLLIEEECIWNILSFSYSKSADEAYIGSINFDLYYRTENN